MKLVPFLANICMLVHNVATARVYYQLSGRDIAPQEAGTADQSDPFVKFHDFKGNCFKTDPVMNNQYPTWNCDFEYDGGSSLLMIEAWDHDEKGKADELGKAYVFSNTIKELGTYCVPLYIYKNGKTDTYMGKICILTKERRTRHLCGKC